MADWSAALAEAYASAPADEYVVRTLELIHPQFADGEGDPDSIRIALDDRAWDLTYEADAPLFAGEARTFEPLAIQVSLPEQTEHTMGTLRIALDNVPRTIWPRLQAAARIRASARLIYREWIAVRDMADGSYEVDGLPDLVIGDLTMRVVTATVLRIEGLGTFVDLLNKGFPRRRFTREDYPGLFGGNA